MASPYPNSKSNQKGSRKARRSDGASAEETLWRQLEKKQLDGLKFLQQFTFGPYVLDFYCAEKTLAVELESAKTDEPGRGEAKSRRKEYLTEHGVRVLAFDNRMVFKETEAVLAAIKKAAAEATALSRPAEEGG